MSAWQRLPGQVSIDRKLSLLHHQPHGRHLTVQAHWVTRQCSHMAVARHYSPLAMTRQSNHGGHAALL